MFELRNSTGALDFSRVTPEIIQSLDTPRQEALLALMKATEAKEAAIARKNAATKRVFEAVENEDLKRQAHEDASSPVPFAPIVAKLEADLSRDLHPHELAEARSMHANRVRAIRESEARQRAVAAFNSNR
jgi:hypothetical protein